MKWTIRPMYVRSRATDQKSGEESFLFSLSLFLEEKIGAEIREWKEPIDQSGLEREREMFRNVLFFCFWKKSEAEIDDHRVNIQYRAISLCSFHSYGKRERGEESSCEDQNEAQVMAFSLFLLSSSDGKLMTLYFSFFFMQHWKEERERGYLVTAGFNVLHLFSRLFSLLCPRENEEDKLTSFFSTSLSLSMISLLYSVLWTWRRDAEEAVTSGRYSSLGRKRFLLSFLNASSSFSTIHDVHLSLSSILPLSFGVCNFIGIIYLYDTDPMTEQSSFHPPFLPPFLSFASSSRKKKDEGTSKDNKGCQLQ